jgi:hypothetical protein
MNLKSKISDLKSQISIQRPRPASRSLGEGWSKVQRFSGVIARSGETAESDAAISCEAVESRQFSSITFEIASPRFGSR